MRKVGIAILLSLFATMSFAAVNVFETYWDRPCGVVLTADDTRSMAVWPQGDLFVTINRNSSDTAMKIYNLQSGLPWAKQEYVKRSGDVTAVPTGLYEVIKGDFTDDGKLVVCNLAHSSPLVLKVYIWDDITTGPRKIYDAGAYLGYRMGDSLDVIGSTADNSATILISGNNNASRPLRLTTADNGRTWTPVTFATAVRATYIEQQGTGASNFYASFPGGAIQLYDATGVALGATPPNRITVAAPLNLGAFAIDAAKDRVFVMGYKSPAGSPANALSVYSLSTGLLLGTNPDSLDANG